MLAYSAQDLILEPFAGAVFGFTPGESTQLSGVQHAGVLVGMIVVAIAGSMLGGRRLGSLRAWTIGGCVASAAALFSLRPARVSPEPAGRCGQRVCARARQRRLRGCGDRLDDESGRYRARQAREGVRMGLWGAAQAIAFGLGGFLGTVASDVARAFFQLAGTAYATVFAAEALLFLCSALLAARVGQVHASRERPQLASGTERYVAGIGQG